MSTDKLDILIGMVQGTNDRLDTLNGRTRSLERQTAVQWFAFGLLGVGILAVIYNIAPLIQAFK